MNIGFIGLGKLGKPCAEVMATKGHNVEAYDIENVESEIITIKYSISEVVENKDIVFIAVPTPHHPDYDGSQPTSHLEPVDFNYDIVKQCVIEADHAMTSDQILVLISTVLPGTVRYQIAPLIQHSQFVYNPYLIAMGSVAWDMVNPELLMLGSEDGDENGSLKKVIEFYNSIIENDCPIICATWDECECLKVFYNTFISVKIGLVNMIQDVAERLGNIDVDVVTDALAASSMRITGPQYMRPGMGDGGGCHPRDNIALRTLAKRLDLGYDLFGSIMESREIQAENLAARLVQEAEVVDLPVYIHGRAYKPGVPYENGSYSILVGESVQDQGVEVIYLDPLIPGYEPPASVRGVILLAHSASTTYHYTSVDTLDQFYTEFEDGSVVVDPWRNYTTDKDILVVHYGNTRNS